MGSLLRRLSHLEGTVNRSTYALGGVIACALKYSIDWSIASTLLEPRPPGWIE
jgi:hypothetical protein